MFEDEAAHLMHNCSLMWRHHPALGENESVQSALQLGANGEAFDEALRAYRARWARDQAAARSALILRQEEDRKHRAREARHARLLLNCRMAGMHAAGSVPWTSRLARVHPKLVHAVGYHACIEGAGAPEHFAGNEVRSSSTRHDLLERVEAVIRRVAIVWEFIQACTGHEEVAGVQKTPWFVDFQHWKFDWLVDDGNFAAVERALNEYDPSPNPNDASMAVLLGGDQRRELLQTMCAQVAYLGWSGARFEHGVDSPGSHAAGATTTSRSRLPRAGTSPAASSLVSPPQGHARIGRWTHPRDLVGDRLHRPAPAPRAAAARAPARAAFTTGLPMHRPASRKPHPQRPRRRWQRRHHRPLQGRARSSSSTLRAAQGQDGAPRRALRLLGATKARPGLLAALTV